MTTGTLSATREGPDIRFEMELPTHSGPAGESFDHFMVEHFKGTLIDDKGERVDVWEPIHTGTRKWVNCGCEAVGIEYWRARRIDEITGAPIDNPDPVPGGRFRALALYKFDEPGTNVRVLHTHGLPTGEVVVA